jgi:hypothetical protein
MVVRKMRATVRSGGALDDAAAELARNDGLNSVREDSPAPGSRMD